MSTRRLWLTVLLAGLLSLTTLAAGAATVTQVTANDLGVNWSAADTRPDGQASFVSGPATPPLGIGSVQMTSSLSTAKAQLFNYDYVGTALSDIDAISFWDYRSSASTNSAAQRVSLNIEIGNVDNASGFTTLVFEQIYQPGGLGALQTDTWQYWDAFNSGEAIWWSTRAIPGVCAFTCYVTWSDIVAANPNATISGGLGFNIGSGWAGQFSGNGDALSLGVSDNTTTYDFEPLIAPTSKDECKNGGWMSFNNPPFPNQGQCIQFVNTGK